MEIAWAPPPVVELLYMLHLLLRGRLSALLLLLLERLLFRLLLILTEAPNFLISDILKPHHIWSE
jgi:hypothetical protein